MKIGIDGRLWNETGVGRYIRSLFNYLPHDQEITWFLGENEFETLAMPSPKWHKVKAFVHWHSLKEQLVLPFIFWKERLDLLHFPYFSFPVLYPGKFVITIHDLIFDHFKTGKWSTLPGWLYVIKKIGYHIVNLVSTARAEKIITLSNDAKNELIDHYHVDKTKIIVTCESGKLEGGPQRDNLPKKYRPYILYVGNAHPHKNVESLIKAMRFLPKLNLVLVGNDWFFYPRLPQKTNVVLVGSVPNEKLASWYVNSEAFVTASKMEGFGIPPLEAASVGCPVIVSDIPVFHEILGNAAVYFEQNSPRDIATVISSTLKNEKLLSQLVTRGYHQAAKYSWEMMVRQTLDVYKDALAKR